jgi:dihydroxy-acid dehydratase
MVRISDARMSGTAFGTIVLHITPESAIGGPLGLVQSGDTIRLDTSARRIDLMIDETEFERRRSALAAIPASPLPSRGYARLFQQTVTQADQGCDFDFMMRESDESEMRGCAHPPTFHRTRRKQTSTGEAAHVDRYPSRRHRQVQ